MPQVVRFLKRSTLCLFFVLSVSEVLWAQTNRSIHLSWTNPNGSDRTMVVTWLENFGNTGKTQTYVKYGTQSGTYTKKRKATSKLSKSLENDFSQATPLETFVHTAKIKGLKPDTTYYYIVGTSSNWSKENTFSTGPKLKSAQNFSFIMGSDSHSGHPASRRNELAYHILNDPSGTLPGFLFSGGDEVTGNNGKVPYDQIEWARQWHRFFSPDDGTGVFKGAWANLLANIPYMGSDSNHVDSDDSYFDLFNYPRPFGIRRLPEKLTNESQCAYVAKHHPTKRGNNGWYSFNYGNAHFVVLQINTAAWSPDPRFCTWKVPMERNQYEWLEEDLEEASEDPNIKWKFAIWHSAPYSFVPGAAPKAYEAELSEEDAEQRGLKRNLNLQHTVCPLFTKYDVDLVFSGHQHRYERSKLIYNDETTHALNMEGDGGIIDQKDYSTYDGHQKGVVYLVSGGLGNVSSKLTPNQNPYTAIDANGKKVHLKAHHYLKVDVNNTGNQVKCSVIGYEVLPNQTVDFSKRPSVLDLFTITKKGSKFDDSIVNY